MQWMYVCRLWEDGWKSRYYENKFGVDIDDVEFRHQVANAYAIGLCWVLRYVITLMWHVPTCDMCQCIASVNIWQVPTCDMCQHIASVIWQVPTCDMCQHIASVNIWQVHTRVNILQVSTHDRCLHVSTYCMCQHMTSAYMWLVSTYCKCQHMTSACMWQVSTYDKRLHVTCVNILQVSAHDTWWQVLSPYLIIVVWQVSARTIYIHFDSSVASVQTIFYH